MLRDAGAAGVAWEACSVKSDRPGLARSADDEASDGAPAAGEVPPRVANAPDAGRLGRLASSPAQIPWAGWKQVLRRTFSEMITDSMGLAAAGCAFWATLALFPAISTLITLYGLVFDRASVAQQLNVMADLLPPSAFSLIAGRVHELVTQPAATLTLRLAFTVVITLYSSSAGTKAILAALNIAYEERERRSWLRYQATALTMTICAILGAAVGITALVLLPAVLSVLHVPGNQKLLATAGSIAVLLVFVMLTLSVLYRFGPSRRQPRWHWVTPGSVVATLLWLIASAAFSYYVGTFASYDATYGPLGAVAGVMMWFWVTVYAVLLGAELNSELELQTARDSTDGPPRPLGRRGAYVADHVATQ